jgi:arylsulfatase A-like enzyme
MPSRPASQLPATAQSNGPASGQQLRWRHTMSVAEFSIGERGTPMDAKRPNILHIFTDQQRADTIGALGNPIIKTPSFDGIAREGIAFTNAFSPSPVCISARCSMIFGQYPQNTKCYENRPMPTDDRQTFMDALTKAGYRTHGIGKCHFSPDSQALMGMQTRERQEEMVGGENPDERDDYLKYLWERGYMHICDPMGIRGEMYYVPQPAQTPAKVHPTNWVGDRSVAFIETEGQKAGPSKQPWYLFSSFIHPHPPFAPPNPWHKLYRAPLMPLPKVPQDCDALLTYINRHQNRYKFRDQGIDQNLMRNIKAYYYACISFIDYQVGRMLNALEKSGQLDNTLIICTSDHGEHLGDYNCFGKRSMHDTAARVPMLVRHPGRFAGGRTCSRPVSLIDVAPTILNAAGAKVASHGLDGEDLYTVLQGESEREMVLAQHDEGRAATYMIVSEEWKYFYSAADNREFLFDRTADPEETRNKAGIPFLGKTKDMMKRTLIDFLSRTGETRGIQGDDWKVFPRLRVLEDPDAGLLIQDHKWADTRIPGYND